MFVDGELDEQRRGQIQQHFETCPACRVRSDEIRRSLAEFSAVLRTNGGTGTSLTAPALERFAGRLAGSPTASSRLSWWPYAIYGGCAAVLSLLVVFAVFQPRRPAPFLQPEDESQLLPNPMLTPGFAATISKADICETGISAPRIIPAALGHRIFAEYGLTDPRRGGYELDYLIDPALGGSDDPRNLWPQPYSAEWNARLKDALEERLHELVCNGQISLSTAQQDVAANWIAAYRKYFHTNKPIVSHMAFTKDMPWAN